MNFFLSFPSLSQTIRFPSVFIIFYLILLAFHKFIRHLLFCSVCLFHINNSSSIGYEKPCIPKRCCSSKGIFSTVSPCISAPRGFQSDHYLFRIAIGRTYMITVPIITSGAAGNVSTLHQEHVSLHHRAFSRIDR